MNFPIGIGYEILGKYYDTCLIWQSEEMSLLMHSNGGVEIHYHDGRFPQSIYLDPIQSFEIIARFAREVSSIFTMTSQIETLLAEYIPAMKVMLYH